MHVIVIMSIYYGESFKRSTAIFFANSFAIFVNTNVRNVK